ncbi:tetratricopeptide repeat protein [Hydrogenophaga palleronii]|uniref:tetratricopeptide repeat protein n=1 Tax=Hydrogenophaga palleronii TaxID=65655 RepID=UPI0008247D14|nr:tetratricopeptide repeat protein [Hydrogenophaga palleronii]
MSAGRTHWAVLLALWAGVAQANGAPQAPQPGWQTLYEQALQQHAARDFSAAETSARQALALARRSPDPVRGQAFVASSLNALALVRQAQGQHAESIGLLREALGLSEAALGAHPNTASLAFNLAQALEAEGAVGEGRAGEAVAHYERCLAISQGLSDSTSLALRARAGAALDRWREAQHADQLTREARALQAQGQAEAARAAWAQVLAVREAHNPDDPLLAEALNELAQAHMAQQEHAAAEALLARALALVERHQGPQSLEAARLVGTQALLQGERGQEARAQALHERALAIYEGHPAQAEALLGQAQALNHLAGQVYRKRRFDLAEPQFLRALALTEQAVGSHDVRLLPLLDNLQALYRSQGRADEARAYGRRAALLRKAALEVSP